MELRIAHVIGSLGVGGAERHLANLVNAMSAEYRCVICVGPERTGPTFDGDLLPDVELDFVRIRTRSFPIGVFRLAQLLKSKGINVVHTHMYHSNLYGTLAAWLARTPVVVTTEHGENPWKSGIQRWLERRVISPVVDVRFCVSPRILQLRRDSDGVPSAKLRLIVNGTVLPAIVERQEENPEPVIGAVGRFIAAKDFPGLVRAVSELRDRGHRFLLYILGSGPEADAVRNLVNSLELDSLVILPGMVTDMDAWYRKFDIYVSSSIREGLPVALLEAMAHGLPVVATDVGASSETVRDGVGGIIVPPAQPRLLANALETLLADRALRQRYGRGARSRIEKYYSVETVAQSHLKLYRDLLAAKLRSKT